MIVKDSTVVSLPAEFRPDRDMTQAGVWLERMAEHLALRQAAPGSVVLVQEWAVTDDPDVLATWVLPHVCVDCLEGQMRGVDFLRANPGRYVAYATLTYDEPVTP